MRASPTKGLSGFLPHPSLGVNSNSRCIVLAEWPVASLIRLAARPVGAASMTSRLASSMAAMTPCVVVVFPVPGPPVSIITFERRAVSMASICTWS